MADKVIVTIDGEAYTLQEPGYEWQRCTVKHGGVTLSFDMRKRTPEEVIQEWVAVLWRRIHQQSNQGDPVSG